ncbi:hypothetical protein CAPTEDRAFT_185217 [Capitella teleta]|uniref:G-protein coupled receptors family 1 profile domain-containing protein n=1 Tax=Capitella teleta TaxID=283909 RepID=R7T8C4_CAPTE|nr:hypothetical protein CAPTEDRAFT_185217 [Capitella teleta]|eukprot:ELT87234.1 hypothetical protein CAPTEDRAFT_185217 [Capitella teleta]
MEEMCRNATLAVHGELELFRCSEYVITRLSFAGAVSATGFCLNMMMLLLIRLHEPVFSTQNRLVLNLCVNNLVFCAYVLPVYIYDLVRGLDNDWGVFCRLHGFFFMFMQCNVIMAYLHIALHRYFTVVLPGSHIFSYGSARKTWLIVLLSSALLALVMSVGLLGIWGSYGQSRTSGVCTLLSDSSNYKLFGYLVAILLPLVAMVYCYGHILIVVRRHKARLSRASNSQSSKSSTGSSSLNGSIRQKFKSKEAYVTLLSVSVVSVFALSFIPYLLAQHVSFLQNWVIFQAVSGALSYIHALTDPLIYVLGDSSLRRHLKRLFENSKCDEEEVDEEEGKRGEQDDEDVEMDVGPLLSNTTDVNA